MTAGNQVKWAATLSHVCEVSLLGSADLAFWTDCLRPEGLLPRQENGRAQIMILGAAAKYMGLQFGEISISIGVYRPGREAGQDDSFLIGAFNSNRFFAFCERFFFSTPYTRAQVAVGCQPSCLRVARGKAIAVVAQMFSRATRKPAQQLDEQWQAAVHLPNIKRKSGGERFFFARLAGHTERYPYLPSSDSLTMNPLEAGDALSALIDSHFTPHEWIIRPDAMHAKSKTYHRADPLLQSATAD